MKVEIEGVRPRKQRTSWTCGPASLRSIFYHYGYSVSEQELVIEGEIEEEGTDFKTMRKLARSHGFKFYSKENGTIDDLKKWLLKEIPILICYQDWGKPNGDNGHYAVLTGLSKTHVVISDPSNYWEGDGAKFASSKKMAIDNFLKRWFEIEDGVKVKHWFAVITPRKKKRK